MVLLMTVFVLTVVLLCLLRWTNITIGALAVSALLYALACMFFNLNPVIRF